MYKAIEFPIVCSLDQAIDTLQQYGEANQKVYGEFNGHKLYSTETADEIYIKVFGMNRKEAKKYQEEEYKKLVERMELEKKKAISRIPEWNKRGCEVLAKDKWDYWLEIVPIRAKDMYNGMELDCTLELQSALKDSNFDLAKEMFHNQSHSDLSGNLTLLMVKEFCDNGEKFYNMMK